MNDLETLDIGAIDLEEVGKMLNILPYPALHVSEVSLWFNATFAKIVSDMPRFVDVFTTSEHVIFSPSKTQHRNSFRIHPSNKSCGSLVMTYPACLKEKKLAKGFYKLYKCKQGYAIKRYEPIMLK